MQQFTHVNQSIRKTDSIQLLLGKPLFMDDIVPKDALIVKLLRSPHAHAMVKEIDTSRAKNVEGVVDIYTWQDVPNLRYTNAGQTYPEPSAYDRLIIDRHLRFVGDVVAIVAAENEKAADRALKLIRVQYEVLEAILDFHTAKDNPILVHPEENWKALCPVGADNKRNLVATGSDVNGDIEKILADSDIVIDHTYHTKAYNQTMMETFRTYTKLDRFGRLHVISSTQIVFHVRRILSNALGIPKSKIRVEKPRIGGGFGAKQSSVSEVYPAFVTMKTGPRHEMEVHVRLGASKEGKIRALDIYTLSNSGAYSEHGPTTVGLSGHKSIPLYSGSLEAYRFAYDVVYTNRQASGAYRGYGATQGTFAVESAVNELAEKLGMDPTLLRDINMVKQGMQMPAYYNEIANSCALDRCMDTCRKIFDWNAKYPVRDMGNGKVRCAGVAMSMQGSGVSNVDVGSATLRLGDDGTYNLIIGAADMGTGCDTTLAQIAAEVLQCSMEDIAVFGADTDISPYDSGSYASSTAYITGKAVEKAGRKLVENICKLAATMFDCVESDVRFEGSQVSRISTGETLSIQNIATKSQCGNNISLDVTETHYSPVSPPPFMVTMVEIELDRLTGEVKLLDTKAVVDSGTLLNPAIARVQAEGGLAQAIGHTLTENLNYTKTGALIENSFMQYKIPTRLDVGRIQVEFEHTFEPTGPFGAKSIGEIVINTPGPAIAHAIYRATGVWHRELPITPCQIAMKKSDN